jgi:CRISPR-associated protein Cmr1
MHKMTCTIRFLCPAFLGDAHRNGAWRTPPFKAELRGWWRVILAAQGLDWQQIREQEAELFGNAWPDKKACKSKVRLRLSRWDTGKLAGAAPAVGKIQNGKARVDGGLYLGYGAIAYDKSTKGTKLDPGPAIDANEQAELRIGIRTDSTTADGVFQALALMSRYGTVGGRSRNAWGSFVLESEDLPATDTEAILIDWRDALAAQWAQGIGRDEQDPLIWRTRAHSSWEKVMRDLAQLRSDINRHFGAPDERTLLSYPVTKKGLSAWDKQKARLPNSLRLKIVANGDQRYGLLFHMPCRPKDTLWKKHPMADKPDGLARLWQGVHELLDNRNEVERVPA